MPFGVLAYREPRFGGVFFFLEPLFVWDRIRAGTSCPGHRQVFPRTHFLRIVWGIILRDADPIMTLPDIWPLLVFFAVMITLATVRFRKRLD